MEENKNLPEENANANEEVVKETEIAQAKEEVKTVQPPRDKKAKKDKKVKKESKLGKKTKETFNELKKVSWPSFGKVVKNTGVVLVVVLVFLVVVFGFDYVLNLLFKLLTGGNA